MRKSLLSLAILGVLATSVSATAHADNGLKVTGDVHGTTSYQYRGIAFSDRDASVGASVRADHVSGLYGSLKSDTVKFEDSHGETKNGSLHNIVTVGYQTQLPYDLKADFGLSRNVFTGGGGINDLSFSEAFGALHYKGVSLTVFHTIEGSAFKLPGFNNGDTYAELSGTYNVGKFAFGGDLGYSFFSGNEKGVEDTLSLAQLRIGYAVNKDLDVTLGHQLNWGEDPVGFKNSGNNKTYLKVAYKF